MKLLQTGWWISKPWVSNLRPSDQLCPDRTYYAARGHIFKSRIHHKTYTAIRQLGALLIVATPQTNRESARSNICGPFP